MRRFIISILAVAACAGAAETMPAFPTVRVNNYTTLKTWFHDAPHTTATFEMTRTMPSGRQLKSRGSFEFRLGIGMMWRTEHPVRNAMVITSKELKIYDAKGRNLRSTNLEGVPSARFTGAFTQEMSPEFLKQMERAFHVTCRTNQTQRELVVGMKARHSANDLRWLLVVVQRGVLREVYYESARQGLTKVVFDKVRHSDKVPADAFSIVP